jgi:hypothetical protein
MCSLNNSLKAMGLRARQVGPKSIPRELQEFMAVLISYLKNITPHHVLYSTKSQDTKLQRIAIPRQEISKQHPIAIASKAAASLSSPFHFHPLHPRNMHVYTRQRHL